MRQHLEMRFAHGETRKNISLLLWEKVSGETWRMSSPEALLKAIVKLGVKSWTLLICANIRHWDFQSHYVKLPDYSSVTRQGSRHLLSQEKARREWNALQGKAWNALRAWNVLRTWNDLLTQILKCASRMERWGRGAMWRNLCLLCVKGGGTRSVTEGLLPKPNLAHKMICFAPHEMHFVHDVMLFVLDIQSLPL